jgi:hypothetical protein
MMTVPLKRLGFLVEEVEVVIRVEVAELPSSLDGVGVKARVCSLTGYVALWRWLVCWLSFSCTCTFTYTCIHLFHIVPFLSFFCLCLSFELDSIEDVHSGTVDLVLLLDDILLLKNRLGMSPFIAVMVLSVCRHCVVDERVMKLCEVALYI